MRPLCVCVCFFFDIFCFSFFWAGLGFVWDWLTVGTRSTPGQVWLTAEATAEKGGWTSVSPGGLTRHRMAMGHASNVDSTVSTVS
jgi:hypothetical protein